MITVDFRRLELAPGFRVLDVGCGSGRHLGEAVRFEGVQAIGVDRHISEFRELHPRMEYLRAYGEVRGAWAIASADIAGLPFPDACFDLVICAEVLEHVPDDDGAIAELFRVVKPGGSVVVSVPRAIPERICWRLSTDYRNEPGGHIRIYQRCELARKLKQAGAEITGSHYAHALHTPFWWLKCLTGLKREDSFPVKAYHRFLVWDMMKKPTVTRTLEQVLNPIIGKSLVFYCVRI